MINRRGVASLPTMYGDPDAKSGYMESSDIICVWQRQLAEIVARRIQTADCCGDDLEVVLKRRDGRPMKPKIVVLPSG